MRALATSITKSSMLVQLRTTPGAVGLVVLSAGVGPLPISATTTTPTAPETMQMGAGIFGVHWRVNEWQPACVTFGCIVAIDVPVANRGDRSPEVVKVLAVKDRDQGVVDRFGGHREESRVPRHLPAGNI